jgi:predicted NUDIX family NTP pyrophosphohydrolase
MATISAGLLLYRRTAAGLEVLIVHPGGPFWARRDAGAWSIPKGEIADGEDPLAAAVREVQEELGLVAAGPFLPLSTARQAGGKRVHAWAAPATFDPATLHSNTFTIEWPPRSGRLRSFPEVDRAEWCSLDVARRRLLPAQTPWLDELQARLVAGT